MEASRSALTFTPDADAVETLRSEWAWLLPAEFSPVLFSVLGDMFFLGRSGEVFWLNTGRGEIVTVASSAQEFQKLLATEQAGDSSRRPEISRVIPSRDRCHAERAGRRRLSLFPAADVS